MLALDPLQIVEQGVVFGEGYGSGLACPVGGSIGAGKDNGGERLLRLTGGQTRNSHCRCGVGGHLVCVECGSVVAGVAPLDLVDYVRGEDVRLFDDTYCGLGGVSLTKVIWYGANVATRRCLTDRDRAGLATDSRDKGEGVLLGDVVVDTIGCGPVDEACLIWSDVVVLQRAADAVVGRKLCIFCATEENWLAGITLMGAPLLTGLPRGTGSGASGVTILIAAGAVGAFGRACCLRGGIIDVDPGRAEVALLLGERGEGHRSGSCAGVPESVVVAIRRRPFPSRSRWE